MKKEPPDLNFETDRIMRMTDKEVVAEHIKMYDGNKKLARRAIELMQARIQSIVARTWKQ